jgi:hypothetical protein
MFSESLNGLIGGAVGCAVLFLLLRTVQPLPARKDGKFVLFFGRAIRFFGVAALCLGTFFLYAAAHSSPDQRVLAWSVAGTLAAGSFYLFLEVWFVRIEFDEQFIYATSPWRGKRQIPWEAVEALEYSERNQWFVLKTTDQGSVRISIFRSGHRVLVKRICRELRRKKGRCRVGGEKIQVERPVV